MTARERFVLTSKFRSEWNPCRDTIGNHRSVLVLGDVEWLSRSNQQSYRSIATRDYLLDRCSKAADRMRSRIAVIDYHHCWSAGRDRRVTLKYRTDIKC